MSRLYANEEGRVVPTLCEEVTRFRQVKSTIQLPEFGTPSSLYILARPYETCEVPLHISINEKPLDDITADFDAFYRWIELKVPPDVLRPGSNEVRLWSDATAMDAWSIALEAGHSNPLSRLTDDSGATWRSHRMGYLNAVNAEYVIRIRGGDDYDPPPPAIVYENRKDHPRVSSLRDCIPQHIRNLDSEIDIVRALSTWISMGWEHTGSGRATQYAPWDAETILSWGDKRSGHNAQRPIVMCVHYALTFVSAIQSLGIPARCVVLMGTPNGTNGHFVAEVWLREFEKWTVVDPNTDALFYENDTPLSALEVQNLGDDLTDYVRWGKGTTYQTTFPHIRDFIQSNLLKNVCFNHVSIWPHSDLLSRSEISPPGHGSVSYCETDLVWSERDLDRGFGMFKYFAEDDYFNAAPDWNY